MGLLHTFLRFANKGVLRRTVQFANATIRPPRPVCMRVDGHRVYAATLDRIVALWMRKWTSAERYETRLWCELIKPGMVVADVGGNLGVYSLLAARAAGPEGSVHSFEPDEDNFALLERNAQINGYDNIIAHKCAVADEVGTLPLYRRLEHRGDHRIYQTDDAPRPSVEVPVTSLDATFAESGRLDVIKLDIQGAEGKALAGMNNVLAGNPRLSMITEFWPEGLSKCGTEPRDFLARLRDHGFLIRRIDDEKKTLHALADDELIRLCEQIRYTNLLATRSDD